MTVVDRAGTHHPLGVRLLDDSDEFNPSLYRADTILADVEGLLHGTRPIPAPSWPLIAALRQAWSNSQPLVWMAELPVTELPPLEKARLAGTTVRVDVSHGSPRTLAAWTDVSRQAAAHGPALAAISDLLAHQVAVDTDRMVAQTLASLATFSGGANMALAAIGQWPGRRIIVLAPNAMGEMRDWLSYAEASGGAITVVADPYIVENLCIATAGMALGIIGPERLTADQPSHLGIDVSDMVTFALEVAPGAIATWESTGFGGSGGTNPLPSPLLTSITPNTILAGSPDLLTVLVGSNFDPSMSARVTRSPNPPLYVPATYSSLTEATMVMPESEMRVPGAMTVHVIVPSGTPTPESNTVLFTVTPPPTPTLTLITPDEAGAGAVDKIVVCEGTGFMPSMTAETRFGIEAWQTHAAVYLSPTRCSFVLPAAQMDTAGNVDVRVMVPYGNPTPWSNSLPFTVIPPLPQPTLIDITPDGAFVADTGIVVTMTGTNFAAPMSARLTYADGAIVDVPCLLDVTTPTTTCTFTMPDDASDQIGEITGVQAYVHAAVPALSSNSLPFDCWSLPPTLLAMTPTMIPQNNGTDTLVTLYGTNFYDPAFAVMEDPQGSGTFVEKPLTLLYSGCGNFVMPVAEVTVERIIDVRVRVEHSSPDTTVEVEPLNISGAPILDLLTPDEYLCGTPRVIVTAIGRNFTADCVLWVQGNPTYPNGIATGDSAVISATEMSFGWNSADSAETLEVWVQDSAGNQSNRLPFDLIAPAPVITNVSPAEYHHFDAAKTMTVDGTGFIRQSQVLLNGIVQTSTAFVSPTRLTATVDPSNTGNADLSWPVVVRNPAPGGDSVARNITVVPEPTLSSINPTSRKTTDAKTTITLTGTNFTPQCKVRHDSGDMSEITYVNRTTMTCTTNWNTVANYNLRVVDENGHATATKPFNVVSGQMPTVLNTISPTSQTGIYSEVNVHLYGDNFQTGGAVTIELTKVSGSGVPDQYSYPATVHNDGDVSFTMGAPTGPSGYEFKVKVVGNNPELSANGEYFNWL